MTTPYSAQPSGRPPAGAPVEADDVAGDEYAGPGNGAPAPITQRGPAPGQAHPRTLGAGRPVPPGWRPGEPDGAGVPGGVGVPGGPVMPTRPAAPTGPGAGIAGWETARDWNNGSGWEPYAEISGGFATAPRRPTPSGWDPLVTDTAPEPSQPSASGLPTPPPTVPPAPPSVPAASAPTAAPPALSPPAVGPGLPDADAGGPGYMPAQGQLPSGDPWGSPPPDVDRVPGTTAPAPPDVPFPPGPTRVGSSSDVRRPEAAHPAPAAPSVPPPTGSPSVGMPPAGALPPPGAARADTAGGQPPGGQPPAGPLAATAGPDTARTLQDALFHQAPVGLALHDAAGRYVRVNDVLARLNGRSAADHLGRTMSELLGDIGQEMDGLLDRVLRTGEPVTDLEIGVATGGAGPHQTWLASWYPAVDRFGATAGAVLVALDATRAKTAEGALAHAEARARALHDATGADVFHAGEDGALDTDLPRWRATTGQARAQTTGFGWLDAVHVDDRERVGRSWRRAVERREDFDGEFRVPAVAGGERTIAARLVAVPDGARTEWVGVLTDVTDARAAAALRSAAAGAAEEVGWRTEQSRRLTSALGRAVTVDDVIAAVLDGGGRAARAVSRGVALIDEGGDRLRFRSLVGTSAEYAARWSEVALGAIHPLAEVIRGRRPLFLGSRDELAARWPVADLVAATESGSEQAWALLPLTTTDAPFGVLHLGFPTPREFDDGDQSFLVALADQCAQALERATLFERLLADATEGRRAREEAEADLAAAHAATLAERAGADLARLRLEQLARAGAVVSAAPDPDRALSALSAAVVAEIADVCAVHLTVLADGGPSAPGASAPAAFASHPAAFAVRDGLAAPAPGDLALALPAAGPLAAVAAGAGPTALAWSPPGGAAPADSPADPEGPEWEAYAPPSGPAAGAARPGPQAAALDGAWTPALARWVREIGGHSAAAVPVMFRGRPVGVMTLIAAGDRAAFTEDDLPFVTELAARTAPALERAEAGGRNRGGARSLQNALLPRVQSPAGIEVATSYLPAGGEGDVGGDWFDVIDLGAGRAALVIGDVMGRGVPAAAVTAQLRAAARTCARLDLPPAEVLTQLDGIVADLADDQIATCIYAVIETDTGLLTLASAGHPPPLVVAPDGLVSRLYMAVATPLGLAGDAVTEYTVSLGSGSLLALFTDGLVRGPGLDIDAGVSNLAAVLARPAEEWGGRLADLAAAACAGRVRPGGPVARDDVALLLARLPVTDDAVEPLDVTADPSVGLGQVRAQVRLALENASVDLDVIDTVVLVLSELVGNALVHGRPPLSVRVRSLGGAAGARDGTSRILVEVGDGGGRLPRRRRAGTDDETGRGLDLVGRLTRRWGSRPSGDGKLVWAEIDPGRV